jgi:hypothetical protein
MNYAKPEIRELGDAASIVRGIGKPFHAFIDFIFPPPRWLNFIPAYDLDE